MSFPLPQQIRFAVKWKWKSRIILISPKTKTKHRRSFGSAAAPSGAGIFQRLSSFFVGAGLMALGTQYFLYLELKEGNKVMLDKQKELEKRLAALEK